MVSVPLGLALHYNPFCNILISIVFQTIFTRCLISEWLGNFWLWFLRFLVVHRHYCYFYDYRQAAAAFIAASLHQSEVIERGGGFFFLIEEKTFSYPNMFFPLIMAFDLMRHDMIKNKNMMWKCFCGGIRKGKIIFWNIKWKCLI